MTIENIIVENMPTIVLSPKTVKGTVILTHGYGGNKEEQLGLAWKIAQADLKVYDVDLRGHGENTNALGMEIKSDIDHLIDNVRTSGLPVIAIGHSLGGRLSLTSNADFAIGLSPALDFFYSERTQEVLSEMRSYRVRTSSETAIFEILENLAAFQPSKDDDHLIVYGSRDVPEIIRTAKYLGKTGAKIIEVENALHSDIFTLGTTAQIITNQIQQWLN
jgi:Lysophospholipase